MKKLSFLLVPLALVGTVHAADVQVYGRVDTGLSVTDPHRSGDNGAVELKSGIFAGSRFGILVQEDLGDGLKVRVKLENAFDASTGTWNGTSENRLFGRESSVALVSDYGTFAFGRIGMVTGALGSFSSLDFYDPFETGFTDASIPATWSDIGTVDESIVYASPEFAGFNVKAQFSFTDTRLDANGKTLPDGRWTDNAHPWGLAAEYRGVERLFVGFGVGGIHLIDSAENAGRKNPLLVNAAVNYDFGVVKPFFTLQYSEHFGYATGASAGLVMGDFRKTAYLVGATAPLAGGTFRVAAQYADGKDLATGRDFSKQVYSVGYTYPLGKSTLVYGAASFAKGGGMLSRHNADATGDNRNVFEFGIDHMF